MYYKERETWTDCSSSLSQAFYHWGCRRRRCYGVVGRKEERERSKEEKERHFVPLCVVRIAICSFSICENDTVGESRWWEEDREKESVVGCCLTQRVPIIAFFMIERDERERETEKQAQFGRQYSMNYSCRRFSSCALFSTWEKISSSRKWARSHRLSITIPIRIIFFWRCKMQRCAIETIFYDLKKSKDVKIIRN